MIKSRRLRCQFTKPEWKKVGVISEFFTSKHIGKGPLGRPRCRWELNINIYLKEIVINTKN
jgi:hypothetical protein